MDVDTGWNFPMRRTVQIENHFSRAAPQGLPSPYPALQVFMEVEGASGPRTQPGPSAAPLPAHHRSFNTECPMWAEPCAGRCGEGGANGNQSPDFCV